VSLAAHKWATAHRLSHTRKSVLMHLANYATHDESQAGVAIGSTVCWPSIHTLAIELGLSTSTVKRVLRELAAAGIIRREHRTRTWGTGGRTSDLIWLDTNRAPIDLPDNFRVERTKVTPERAEVLRQAGLKSAEARRARRVMGYGNRGMGLLTTGVVGYR
jgi:DNA-binding transcriptional MocR family regulator